MLVEFGALRPQNMVDAMVQDTSVHLTKLESARNQLETCLAEGKPDEEIFLATQSLAKHVKDYKAAAAHVKRASAKPKPKAKKAEEAKEPDQNAGPA